MTRGNPGSSIFQFAISATFTAEPVEPVLRFEIGPGEQMQVDWAVIRRDGNRLPVFVATLGWSRAAYVENSVEECPGFGGEPRIDIQSGPR